MEELGPGVRQTDVASPSSLSQIPLPGSYVLLASSAASASLMVLFLFFSKALMALTSLDADPVL